MPAFGPVQTRAGAPLPANNQRIVTGKRPPFVVHFVNRRDQATPGTAGDPPFLPPQAGGSLVFLLFPQAADSTTISLVRPVAGWHASACGGATLAVIQRASAPRSFLAAHGSPRTLLCPRPVAAPRLLPAAGGRLRSMAAGLQISAKRPGAARRRRTATCRRSPRGSGQG